jgi:hypothetical protein
MENEYDNDMRRIGARRVRADHFTELSETELKSVERRLGYALPADYREFLRKYGMATGTGDVKFTNMNDPEEIESSVDVFYGVGDGDTYDLLGQKHAHRESMLPHILPIASSPGGHFCLSLAGNDRGKVYWWELHSDRDNLELVANSFRSFVNSLRVVED